LQLKLIYIIQLLLQLQLTATYFSVIFLFQLQLQLTEGTLAPTLTGKKEELTGIVAVDLLLHAFKQQRVVEEFEIILCDVVLRS